MNIDIEKAKQETVHHGLMEILCLATILRDKIHIVKSDELVQYDNYPDILDAFQTDLNEFKAKVCNMISTVLFDCIDDFMDPSPESTITVHPVPNGTPSLKTKSEKENYTKNLNRADSIVSSFLPEWIDYAIYQADEYDSAVDAKALIRSIDILNTDAGKGLIEAIEQMRLFALSAIKDKIKKEAIEVITTKTE